MAKLRVGSVEFFAIMNFKIKIKMNKQKEITENLLAITLGVLSGAVIGFIMFFFSFNTSIDDVINLQLKKQNIEMRLKDECRIVRNAAKLDAESFNEKVKNIQHSNKRIIIKEFINDNVDALETIEID